MTLVRAAACAAALLAMSGCAAAADVTSSGEAASLALPPPGAVPDYQLGGAYPPADGVGIVGRDRGAEPADDVYSICYVNAFQTQPGELASWPEDLLLHAGGASVFDPDWPDEALADTSTDDKRGRIAAIVTPWITGCAADGFDAVEFDNLDSYTRSGGALDLDDNLALATELVDAAHAAGLAAGQKNAAEDAAARREQAGFDFAVVEECAAYDECEAYTEVYGPQVIDIEYTDQLPRSFAEMCADADAPASMVLRDRDLLPAGAQGHTFETC
ncbi:endo alpha-1,4 polygalactosaminidase [Microbacterium aerolatum]|uniref:endo alpha-1,4 polygalactosaminidase n=1 Tax=Microbacterium aerolatum TaxID=153731 RepID=UPI0020015971|nr:endo alpha-1,4 polygalactosaminidase [Microbacterium aerolatum]MCK3768630.1 endo alpha-1,4 polygalactosaminidase [Microbacterium aerolatum]